MNVVSLGFLGTPGDVLLLGLEPGSADPVDGNIVTLGTAGTVVEHLLLGFNPVAAPADPADGNIVTLGTAATLTEFLLLGFNVGADVEPPVVLPVDGGGGGFGRWRVWLDYQPAPAPVRNVLAEVAERLRKEARATEAHADQVEALTDALEREGHEWQQRYQDLLAQLLAHLEAEAQALRLDAISDRLHALAELEAQVEAARMAFIRRRNAAMTVLLTLM